MTKITGTTIVATLLLASAIATYANHWALPVLGFSLLTLAGIVAGSFIIFASIVAILQSARKK